MSTDKKQEARKDLTPSPFTSAVLAIADVEELAYGIQADIGQPEYTSAIRAMVEEGVTDPTRKLEYMYDCGVLDGVVSTHKMIYPELLAVDEALRTAMANMNDIAILGGDNAEFVRSARNAIASMYNAMMDKVNHTIELNMGQATGMSAALRAAWPTMAHDQKVQYGYTAILYCVPAWIAYVYARHTNKYPELRTLQGFVEYEAELKANPLSGLEAVSHEMAAAFKDHSVYHRWVIDFVEEVHKAAHERWGQHKMTPIPIIGDNVQAESTNIAMDILQRVSKKE